MKKNKYAKIFWRLLLAASLWAQTGCATKYIAAKCPAPIIPEELHYPISDLKPEDGHSKVATAYAKTVHLQHGYIEELKKILEGYQH